MEAMEEHTFVLRGMERGRAEGRAQGRAEGRAQGRAEGRAQGRAEGRDQGRAEGKAETLLSLLRLKFGELPAGIQAQVAAADAGQLDAWAVAVLTATSLDEALAAKP